MSGRLFTDYFLTDGIKDADEWRSSVEDAEEFATFREGVSQRYEALCRFENPNEAVTEQELIRPVLQLLGWVDYLPQQGSAGKEDIPDHLLLADSELKDRATAERNPKHRFRHATVVQESKRFGLPLDKRQEDDDVRVRTPHGQILRYLLTADIESEANIRWGVLTNGKVWRLYDHRARPRATGYFEADLEVLLQSEKENDLRIFHLLFHRESYVKQAGAATTFLETALEEGRRYEERVAQDLSGVVFERVFPGLVEALAEKSGERLPDCRDAALVFLYRVLFVLYAEDRGLLPVHDSRYDDYGIRKRVRYDIANRMKDDDTFSGMATNYYDRLVNLFKIIDSGDPSIGLPAYNGGLFASEAAPMLERVRLSDAEIAQIIYDLSHAKDPQNQRRFVNYRDMSVQQLGSIYERLLEREPVRDEAGKIIVRPNPYARKDSGSFYTPQELVDLIVDRTLKPLVEERLKAFEEKADALKSDRRPKSERRAELERVDPAVSVLDLKVLDPAMGSGHFLVTAVDFLSDYVAELIEYVPAVPSWLDGGYVSPLEGRVEAIRGEIIRRSRESNWVLDEAQLTDQAIIRRMVLKRCIYGVDKNPLTVELAKVSLWLHSFTVGAPLSFLDHHLRCGDSLVGLRVRASIKDLEEIAHLFVGSAIQGAETATNGMQLIEEMSDSDVSEVRESAVLFQGVEETTADLRGLLDFLCGWRWLTAGMKKKEYKTFETPLVMTLSQRAATAFKLLAHGPRQVDDDHRDPDDATFARFSELWHDVRAIADRERFLHWEVAFPGVWRNWQNTRPQGGFDAVIGNPPWDRIKLQEVEWFSTRDPELAHAPTAAARRTGIQRLRDRGSPLTAEFDAARTRSESLARMVRSYGDYPLLGGGDVNLYSAFVERAMSLIKPDGIVGLLTPSGIYSDKTAARFFKSVSTSGRVGGLFDFENRRLRTGLPPFFPDVDSRFKFCALIFGGEGRRFDQTQCAFFLHDTKTIQDEDRCFPMTPAVFARVNPNTGTAPVFRRRRDAEITRRIYERHPVLVDRSRSEEKHAWPVKYATMFHMTNDSALFRTEAQLETDGFYPVQGNRWKKGNELYLPLYQGRMIHQFDHRANSVRFNPENTHNPYLSEEVTEAEHADPKFSPQAQYWVPASMVQKTLSQNPGYGLGFRDIARSTDARTVIATVVPWAGYGNTIPLLIEDVNSSTKVVFPQPILDECSFSALVQGILVANLNAVCFDFVARQKAQGTHLNWYIVEQLPVITPAGYNRRFGDKTALNLVRDHVIRLTYTAHDLAPFARDLGYDGPPFVWNEEERRHLRARLDALYFHLYGLTRADAGYILDAFPIVLREDEKAFGRYRTREMILAYMNALDAGDTETDVEV